MRQRLEGEAAASCKFTDDVMLRSPLKIVRFIKETNTSQHNHSLQSLFEPLVSLIIFL